MIQTSANIHLDSDKAIVAVASILHGETITLTIEEESTYGGVVFFTQSADHLRTIANAINEFLEGEVA